MPPAERVQGRVLVVDDNPDNRTLMALMLRHMGAEVELASDGASAIAMALECPFDLVLMDLRMPGLGGAAATRELRGRGYTGPVVAISADGAREHRDHWVEAGLDGFLSKPIVRTEFVSVVASYLREQGDLVDPGPEDGPTEREEGIPSSLDPGDPEMEQILDEFVAELPHRMAMLRGAFERKDRIGLAEIAHCIKGVGGSFGYWILTELAADLEEALRAGDERRVASLVEGLERTSLRIRRGRVPNRAEPDPDPEAVSLPQPVIAEDPVGPAGDGPSRPEMRVLFVCTRIGLRARLAERLLCGLADRPLVAVAAGFQRATAPQAVVREAARLGIEIDDSEVMSVFDLYRAGERFSHVITLCDETGDEGCRSMVEIVATLFGRDGEVVAWDVPHPGSERLGEVGMPRRVELVVERIRLLIAELLQGESIGASRTLDSKR